MQVLEKPETGKKTGLSDFQKKMYRDRLKCLRGLCDVSKPQDDLISDLRAANQRIIREEIVDILSLLA